MPDSKPGHSKNRWAWRIGSIAGIPIHIHASFVLLLVWVAMTHLGASHEFAVVAKGLVLVASVFTIVVLHELGHALVARRFGIATRDITLYPIGGISRLERMPSYPRRSCSSRWRAPRSTPCSRPRSIAASGYRAARAATR